MYCVCVCVGGCRRGARRGEGSALWTLFACVCVCGDVVVRELFFFFLAREPTKKLHGHTTCCPGERGACYSVSYVKSAFH
jgi:hypothetical protein